MKKLALMISSSALMAACAGNPQSVAPGVASTEAPVCLERAAPTGSNLVKKQECIPTSDADRAQTQKDVQAMRDQQARSGQAQRPTFGKGGSGN